MNAKIFVPYHISIHLWYILHVYELTDLSKCSMQVDGFCNIMEVHPTSPQLYGEFYKLKL
jgi:hypothetical protein